MSFKYACTTRNDTASPASLPAATTAFVLIQTNELVLFQRFEELPHVGYCGFLADAVLPGDFPSDFCFCTSFPKGFQDQRSNWIQAKHLAVVYIEDNSAILIASAADSG